MRTGPWPSCLASAHFAAGQADPFSSIRPLHAALATCDGDDCAALSDSIAEALEAGLSEGDAFADGPVQTDFMAAVASDDGRLRVFTWNWPHPDRTSGYGGLVVDGEDPDDLRFTRLLDPSSADRPSDHQSLQPEAWAGALYFSMVPAPVDKDTYLLLGWDDADAQVTRRSLSPSSFGRAASALALRAARSARHAAATPPRICRCRSGLSASPTGDFGTEWPAPVHRL